MIKQISLTQAEQLERAIGAADEAFQVDEQTFRVFYDATARSLWSYLYRSSANATLADDLMQESYYRFLRVRFAELNHDYMKNYLFRIATNLLRDHWRHAKVDPPAPETRERASEEARGMQHAPSSTESAVESDVMCAMRELKPRERQLLWLAYVEGSSHREIAQAAGLREQSVRGLLFRARGRFAKLLRRRGLAPQEASR